jgi:hypothetical protein
MSNEEIAGAIEKLELTRDSVLFVDAGVVDWRSFQGLKVPHEVPVVMVAGNPHKAMKWDQLEDLLASLKKRRVL